MGSILLKISRFFKRLFGMETYEDKMKQLNESVEQFIKGLSHLFTQFQTADINKQPFDGIYRNVTEQTPPTGALFSFKVYDNIFVLSKDINPIADYAIINTHIEKFDRAFINNVRPVPIMTAQIKIKTSVDHFILNGNPVSNQHNLKINYLSAIVSYFKEGKPNEN